MRLFGDVQTRTGISKDSVLDIDDLGNIQSVSPGRNSDADYDFSGRLIVPGFVDLHVHGAGGSDFMDGTVESVRNVLRTHAAFGTTSLLATTLTAFREDVDRAIKSIVAVIESPGEGEATIRGIHLEGPYICSKRRGAQPLEPIRSPDLSELDHWQELAKGQIKQITLAPELPGALDFIRHAASLGVNVSIGHTDASAEQVIASIDAGATQGTHLFNAMSPLSHRAPGAVGALLADNRAYCEIICDGFHLDEMVVKIALKAKGCERILLITDAMAGASMPDGYYELGRKNVIVKEGTAKLEDGTLAGSVLTMNKAFHNITSFTGATTSDAVMMAAYNASVRLGIADTVGIIEVGKAADLAVIDQSTGDIAATISDGKFIYRH